MWIEGLSKLDQGIFEVIPEPLHDVEVVVLEGNFGPDFTDDFGEGGPEIKDNAVGLDAPAIELSEKLFSHTTAIEPRDRFDIENSAFNRISGDLFIAASSSGHIFIDRESSGELEFVQDSWEVISRSVMLLPSMDGRLRSRGIKTSGQPLSNSF